MRHFRARSASETHAAIASGNVTFVTSFSAIYVPVQTIQPVRSAAFASVVLVIPYIPYPQHLLQVRNLIEEYIRRIVCNNNVKLEGFVMYDISSGRKATNKQKAKHTNVQMQRPPISSL